VPTIKCVLPFLAAMAMISPAIAQDGAPPLPLTSEGDRLVLEALDHKVTMPRPDWIGGEDSSALTAEVSPRFVDLGDQAHLELYPRGEGAAFWSRLFGARLTRMPEPVLADFRATVIDVYARSCRPDATAFFQLEPDDGDNLPPLGFVCGSYRDPVYADEGEVTLIGFLKSDDSVAIVYQGWRGKAFEPSDTATWPVTPDELEQQVNRFKTETALGNAD
jgi:hypothetical protein